MEGIKSENDKIEIVLKSTVDGFKIEELGWPVIGPDKDVEKILGRWLRNHREHLGIIVSISGHREIDCPFCEAMLDPKFSFCPECGESLGRIGEIMSNPNARITVEIYPDEEE